MQGRPAAAPVTPKPSGRNNAMDAAAVDAAVALLVMVLVAVPPLAIVVLAAARATPRQLTEMLMARDGH